MVRTQIQLEEKQYQALKELAARRQTSIAALIRRAVDEWLEKVSEAPKAERRRRAIAAAGRFRSGLGDLAEKHDEYLAKMDKGEVEAS